MLGFTFQTLKHFHSKQQLLYRIESEIQENVSNGAKI